MRKINFILFMCISAILVSCGDDNSDDRLLLTNANLAGSYKIAAFSEVVNESATSSTGSNVNVSTTTNTGDIYSLDIVISENGTYTASGQYTLDFVTRPNGSAQVTGSSIIDVEAAGTYSVSSLNNTITFVTNTSTEDDFIVGTYNVVLLNTTTLSIVQEAENESGSLITSTKTSYSFVK